MLPELRGIVPEKEEEVLAAYSAQTREWFMQNLAPQFFEPMTKFIEQTFQNEFRVFFGEKGPQSSGSSGSKTWPGHASRLVWNRKYVGGKTRFDYILEMRGTIDYKTGKAMTFPEYIEKGAAAFNGVSSVFSATANPIRTKYDPVTKLQVKVWEAPSGPYIARLRVMPGFLLMEARMENEDVWHVETMPLQSMFRIGWPELERQKQRLQRDPNHPENQITPRLAHGMPADGGWSGYLFMLLPHVLLSSETYSAR
jgi:hypothetical protein